MKAAVSVVFIPFIRFLMKPITKLRKFRRLNNMRQIKVAAGGLVVTSCFITLFLYYWYHSSSPRYKMHSKIHHEITTRRIIRISNIPMKHMPLNEIYPDDDPDESLEWDEQKPVYMVNTAGCQIPALGLQFRENLKPPRSCGKRSVFLKKITGTNIVRVSIKARAMKQYLRRSKNFSCCYRFIKPSSNPAQKNKKNEYTHCKKIQDNEEFKLEYDFINIKCFEYDSRNTTHVIYSDVYPFIKKIDLPKQNKNDSKPKYNVLMMGMDSMSLFRFSNTMPRTVNFFLDNFWLAFRGYHKVGDNTFPNLMAAFTGKNLSTITERCTGKMDKCNDLLIWSKFKESGYVTAYGEDYLRLPDTFNKKFAFKNSPTDHYLRTFFLHGEVELHNKSLVCAGKLPSGQQLLDYAADFASTYRDSSFFGVFWMNSFSHNVQSEPQDADKMFENFFNQLSYIKVLENTFIIFFSDHGIRFGDYRLIMESYYDERLPAFLMWVPLKFKRSQGEMYRTASDHQFLLLTPYDLYNSLVTINGLSRGGNYTEEFSESCPKCSSLFDVTDYNRTCADVGIHQKWCSCHKLFPLDIQDPEGKKSVLHAVGYLKKMVQNVKTERCWGCMQLSLNKIIRIHFYHSPYQLFYVVAFTMTPGNVSYEATVVRKAKNDFELIGGVSVISVYRGLGKCTIQPRDRLFCVCQRKDDC